MVDRDRRGRNPTGSKRRFCFATFELDIETDELRKSGIRVKLSGQPIEVLKLLVERHGQLVTREELQAAMWPDETNTDFEHGVNNVIQRIRRVLDDDANNPRFIETLPRRGYRFIAPVEVSNQPRIPVGARQRNGEQPRISFKLTGAFVAVTLVTLLATGWIYPPNIGPPKLVKFVVAPGREIRDPAVSPDGRRIAYVTSDDNNSLWIRDFADEEPRRVPDSEGALRPFWAPNSRDIAFASEGVLWRVRVDGALRPQAVCRMQIGFQGGAWSHDSTEIVFGNTLHRVPASGGTPKRIIHDFGLGYIWDPEFLPLRDRRVIVVHRMTATGNRILIFDLDEDKHYDIGEGRNPSYSPTGHLVYQEAGPQSRIWAQPFSVDDLKTTGEKFLVADHAFGPSLSADGTLVYVDGDAATVEHLVWRNRSGGSREVVSAPLPEARFIDLSPREDMVAFSAVTEGRRSNFIVDVGDITARPRQFTIGAVGTSDNVPKWSPDGYRIAYIKHSNTDHADLGTWIKPVSGASSVRAFRDHGIVSEFWGNDSKEYLVIHGPSNEPDGEWTIKYGEVQPDGKVVLRQFLESGERAVVPKLSPSGKHIVYSQGATIFVRTFPDGDGPWPLLSTGENATQPRWSPNGNEIFYVKPGGVLMAAQVETEPSFRVIGHEELFRSDGLVGHAMPMYDVSSDAQRIILLDPVPNRDPQLRVTQNWYEEFRER